MSGSNETPIHWEIDLQHDEDQKQAFMAELALHPPMTLGQKLACKIGNHGKKNTRKFTIFWKLDGRKTQKHSDITRRFCVRCGKSWTVNNAMNPD